MGLGDMAKKWAKDKATELLSADSGKSEAAGQRADETEREAKSSLSEQALLTAFPKLGEWKDEQEAKQSQKETEAQQQEQSEIKSLPTAQVQLTASGWMNGQWSGQMHYGWNEIAGEGLDKLLWFELFAAAGEEAVLDGHRLRHWSFQLYGWHGDGTYDLVDLLSQREATGWSTDFLEWGADFADADDMGSYFHSDAGPSSVTVADGGKRFSVSISTGGAYGDLLLGAEITRS